MHTTQSRNVYKPSNSKISLPMQLGSPRKRLERASAVVLGLIFKTEKGLAIDILRPNCTIPDPFVRFIYRRSFLGIRLKVSSKMQIGFKAFL
ncbi:myosin 5 [Moniliophthora roreri]|nr:myosin 5 [Moniliophthora roreri]